MKNIFLLVFPASEKMNSLKSDLKYQKVDRDNIYPKIGFRVN